MEGNGDSLLEFQVALVVDSVLKLIESLESGSSTALVQENNFLKDVGDAIDDLVKLISANDITSGKAMVENLSDMEDFLRLMLRLIQEMTTSTTSYKSVRL